MLSCSWASVTGQVFFYLCGYLHVYLFTVLFCFKKVCHNIYRIKTCMDLGKPVILLNLDDLYESLYDALNQYFSTWGDRKFVDLGLGTHRVKTFVNENFRYGYKQGRS